MAKKKPLKKSKHVYKQRKTIRKTSRPIRRRGKNTSAKNRSKGKAVKRLVSKTSKVSKKGKRKGIHVKRRKSVTPVRVQRKDRFPTYSGKPASKGESKFGETKYKVTKLRDHHDARNIGNLIRIDLPPGKFASKIAYINKLDLRNLIKEYTPTGRHKGFNYGKFASSFQIILRTMKGKKIFERANKMAGFDVSVDWSTMKQWVLDFMVSYQDNYLEALDELGEDDLGDSDWVYNPNKIIAVFIRVFYITDYVPPSQNPDYTKDGNL